MSSACTFQGHSAALCRPVLLQRASPCGPASTASACLLSDGGAGDEFCRGSRSRDAVSQWCQGHVPTGWREAQTGASDEEFVAFQRAWFAELRKAGFAVPHWPREWGGGLTIPEQVVLYSQLAAHDAPRLVLAFVAIHHAAATLLAAGTSDQQHRHLPAILDGEIWVQGFSEPEAGSDLASLKTTARKEGDRYIVNGQKVWASGAMHADWCLLLARTDLSAPKRQGISYFLLDMRSPGVDVRPIRQATGEAHFGEIFLTDVEIPAACLLGEENAGWRMAQETLGAERGMTILELAERLGNVGFRRLIETCMGRARRAASDRRLASLRPAGGARDGDHRATRSLSLAGRAAQHGSVWAC